MARGFMDNNKTLNIVDVSAVGHRGYFAFGRFSVQKDGETYNTGALYDVLRVLKTYGVNNDFVFCFDSKTARKEENEDYKAGRTKMEGNYYDQISELLRGLSSAGFVCLKEEGYEADDLIYSAVQEGLKMSYNQINIITNDYDMASCIDKQGRVTLRCIAKSRSDIDAINFANVLSSSYDSVVPFNTIVLFKALVHDTSDNIKGVRGFGKVAFANLIAKMTEDGETFFNVRSDNREEALIRKYIPEDKIDEALESLSMAKPRPVEVQLNFRPIDTAKLIEFCTIYKMNSIIKLYQC